MRISRYSEWKFYNLPEILLKYRINSTQISAIQSNTQNRNYVTLIREHINFYGYLPTLEDMKMHFNIINHKKFENIQELKKATDWLYLLYDIKNEKLSDQFFVFREKLLMLYLENSHIENNETFYYSSPLVDNKKLFFFKEKTL
jgi:hypothetical protein